MAPASVGGARVAGLQLARALAAANAEAAFRKSRLVIFLYFFIFFLHRM
ncbi:MAG: hypothetical protein WAV05_08575 [Anaerolineales bacterium]